jgi:uncharacterized protein (DUF2062 family)
VGSILSLEMYSNPLTLPFICYVDLRIGYFLFGLRPEFSRLADFKNLNWEFISQTAKILFAGSTVLGIVAAVLSYFATLKFITVRRRRK